MSFIRRLLSALPARTSLSAEDIAGYGASQGLAYECAKAIAAEMKEGWTETQTARLMDVWLRDNGVKNYFHTPFAWFGDRTRFDGVVNYADFSPKNLSLKPGDAVILDVAPLVNGYPGDIGYPCSLGSHEGVVTGRAFLEELRDFILNLFKSARNSKLTGGAICEAVSGRIRDQGYDVVHHRYPGGVLGHRVHPISESWRPPTFTPFGFGAFASALRGGVFPELMNEEHHGALEGAWALEPHFGGPGFGCKFEEVLLVRPNEVRWLSEARPW